MIVKAGDDVSPLLFGKICARVFFEETFDRLIMGEIETAFSGNEKLATHRWHRIVKVNLGSQLGGNFSSKEPCRTSSDNGNVFQDLCF